jgi:hypothetical protein
MAEKIQATVRSFSQEFQGSIINHQMTYKTDHAIYTMHSSTTKRLSQHAMKDCKTFLKLQEVARNKQAEARRQGYEGNTNNAPPTSQKATNGAVQGQSQPNQGNDNDGGYIPSKDTSPQ